MYIAWWKLAELLILVHNPAGVNYAFVGSHFKINLHYKVEFILQCTDTGMLLVQMVVPWKNMCKKVHAQSKKWYHLLCRELVCITVKWTWYNGHDIFFHITSVRINKQKGVNQLTELYFS